MTTQAILVEYIDDAEHLLKAAMRAIDSVEFRANVRGAYALIDVVRQTQGWNVDDCATEVGYVRAIRNVMVHVPMHFAKKTLDVISTDKLGAAGKPLLDLRLDDRINSMVMVPTMTLEDAIAENKARNSGTRRDWSEACIGNLRKVHERWAGNLREIGLQAVREARQRLSADFK